MSDAVSPPQDFFAAGSATVHYPGGAGYPGSTAGAAVPRGSWSLPAGAATVPATVGQAETRIAHGIVAGVAVAVVAAFAWYQVVALSGYQIAYVAVAVGFAIGAAIRFGAGALGGKLLPGVAGALTLATMFGAEFLIARKFAGDYFVSIGDNAPLPLLVGPADAFSIVADSLAADPVTLLFWLAAVAAAVRVTYSQDLT